MMVRSIPSLLKTAMLRLLSTPSSPILKSHISTYATENRDATTPELREPKKKKMSNKKVVLITGASSGVGQATAGLLARNGYKVFGTSRNPAGAEAISGVEMLSLDVRSDDSVAACVKAVADAAGRIDVLVNNAGYELSGALEEIS